MFWNIDIEINDGSNKSINIHDEAFSLKYIINAMVARYTDINPFFNSAKTENDIIYKTEYITVTIMNSNLGYINFHGLFVVQSIKISKQQLFLLKNI